ncbi:MAG: permease [Cyclobacteriaceae bacterium]|nr:MAG: permease [Cyclobacteriaceae bacterium]
MFGSQFNWLLKMAWRDSRKSRSRLFLFVSSIILGVASLVAIQTFSENLQNDINSQARTMIGADLVLQSNRPFTPEILELMDSLGGDQSTEVSFASMVYFHRSEGTRLVQIRALEGDFPYYGTLETNPVSAADNFRDHKLALVDQTLLLQFDSAPGDSIQVGAGGFKIAGSLLKVPGQTGITATAAPPVYIPMAHLEQTGLITKGSRIRYLRYFKFDQDRDIKKLVEGIEDRLELDNINYDTIESTKEDLGESFANLTEFLSFVSFAALLLGCIGVASSVHIYVKEKLNTIAVLRCVGATGNQAFGIYLIQILVMGVLGSLVGAAGGSFLQLVLPMIFSDFLPLDVSLSISWRAIITGVIIGVTISLLFALLPLIGVRKVSPFRVLRLSFEKSSSITWPHIWVAAGIFVFIYVFSYLQGIGGWLEALWFTLGVLGAFGFLGLVAKLVVWLLRKFTAENWNYLVRQSLANLHRPMNQTMILIISIGLGTALIATMYFLQQLLLSQVSFSSRGDQPNMVLFDIQTEQKDEIRQLAMDHQLPVIQEVPVVTIQLMEINGIDKLAADKDSTLNHPNWSYNREYRVTYRNHLIDSETLVEGVFTEQADPDTTFISMDEGFAERIGVKIGDELVFNVQGAQIKTILGSTRKIEWNRVQTNFIVVFPTGILENAPQFHVLMTKVPSEQASADFQKAVVRQYPNISIIDLTLILKTVNSILDKVAFVIRFMALFSIITGLIVFISSVIISKYQRIRESVLLRTLGAKRNQIITINALEYFFLGSLASMAGMVLSLVFTWILAYYNFDSTFVPTPWPLVWLYFTITSITVLIGVVNSNEVVNKAPLEVLRSEI